ncbi:hypothetical protein [Intrasporangium sp.]|uniref:hypothetical protein n=1 Tax=Intrasporangium sp. TaxID=1925024 RepID=UPI0033659BFA
MEATPARGPVTRGVTLVLVALLSAFFAWTLPRADAQPVVTATAHAHAGAQASPAPHTAAQQAFHDQMRRLWEDHVTWTRLAIVTFAADGQPGFGPTAARLLQNQVDIGDAIKPFYGDAAGNALTALLHDHITIAVELLQAAKDGNTAAFTDAKDRWYANSDDIADFLAQANPRFWPQSEMRAAMRMHLDQTLAEAAHELGGDYAASVADYDAVHAHILAMADLLSNGLIGAFPQLIR